MREIKIILKGEMYMLRMISKQEEKEIETIVRMVVGDANAIYNYGNDNDFFVIPSKTEGNILYQPIELKKFLVRRMAEEFGGEAEDYRSRISVNKGATKLVIIDSAKDYVIKIPFTGNAYNKFDKFGDTGEYSFYPFNYNYCHEEVKTFQDLPDNVKCLFAETRFAVKVNYVEVYIQEQVEECFDDSWKNDGSLIIADLPREERIPMESFRDKGYIWELDRQFIYDILVRYGEMTVENLMDAIYDEDINDLHGENYGYTADELPKIFDYSGFRS